MSKKHVDIDKIVMHLDKNFPDIDRSCLSSNDLLHLLEKSNWSNTALVRSNKRLSKQILWSWINASYPAEEKA